MSLPTKIKVPPDLLKTIEDLPPLPPHGTGQHLSLSADLVDGELVIIDVRRSYLLKDLVAIMRSRIEEDREWLDAPPGGTRPALPKHLDSLPIAAHKPAMTQDDDNNDLKIDFAPGAAEQIAAMTEKDPALREALTEMLANMRQAHHAVKTGRYRTFDDAIEAITGKRPEKIKLSDLF